MAGLNGTITIEWQHRRGKVKLSKHYATKHNLEENVEYDCLVHGIFQVGDTDGSDAYVVCELQSGVLVDVTTDKVRFVDTHEYMPVYNELKVNEGCTNCSCHK